MVDPLRVLRDHVQGRIGMTEITVEDVHYYAFGDSAFAASTPTCLKSPAGNFYTLESIVELWKHRQEPHANYVRDASRRGIQPVTVVQRQMLLDFLHGNTREEPEEFDLTAPMAIAASLDSLTIKE